MGWRPVARSRRATLASPKRRARAPCSLVLGRREASKENDVVAHRGLRASLRWLALSRRGRGRRVLAPERRVGERFARGGDGPRCWEREVRAAIASRGLLPSQHALKTGLVVARLGRVTHNYSQPLYYYVFRPHVQASVRGFWPPTGGLVQPHERLAQRTGRLGPIPLGRRRSVADSRPAFARAAHPARQASDVAAGVCRRPRESTACRIGRLSRRLRRGGAKAGRESATEASCVTRSLGPSHLRYFSFAPRSIVAR